MEEDFSTPTTTQAGVDGQDPLTQAFMNLIQQHQMQPVDALNYMVTQVHSDEELNQVSALAVKMHQVGLVPQPFIAIPVSDDELPNWLSGKASSNKVFSMNLLACDVRNRITTELGCHCDDLLLCNSDLKIPDAMGQLKGYLLPGSGSRSIAVYHSVIDLGFDDVFLQENATLNATDRVNLTKSMHSIPSCDSHTSSRNLVPIPNGDGAFGSSEFRPTVRPAVLDLTCGFDLSREVDRRYAADSLNFDTELLLMSCMPTDGFGEPPP